MNILTLRGPKPLIAQREIRAEADWIQAGKRVVDEVDFLHLRTIDPKYIDEVRSGSPIPQNVILRKINNLPDRSEASYLELTNVTPQSATGSWIPGHTGVTTETNSTLPFLDFHFLALDQGE